MNWTFTDNPSESSIDALRLAVGDTTQEDPRLSDEQVNYFLSVYPASPNLAAALAAEAIAAKYASMLPLSVGDLDNAPHLKVEYYLKLASLLRSRVTIEEASESIVASPGYSSDAFGRGAIFKRT